jgi:TonB family protein
MEEMNRDVSRAVSFQGFSRSLVLALLLIGVLAVRCVPGASGQEVLHRKVRSKTTPPYPDLARRLKITGVVRVVVTVSANGAVKDVKLTGGNPVLANAALDAVKEWRFEPSTGESTGLVEFRFEPGR